MHIISLFYIYSFRIQLHKDNISKLEWNKRWSALDSLITRVADANSTESTLT